MQQLQRTLGCPALIMLDQSLLSRKTRGSLGAVVNESAADMSCDFGRKMLAKFGWAEGKGLGKNEDGMKSHISVKQRADLLGLGAKTEAASTSWAPPADLPRPPVDKVKPPKSKKKKREREAAGDAAVNLFGVKPAGSGIIPGLDDAALFELCGGARLGRRAHPGLQVGKEKRVSDADAEFMAKYGGGGSGASGGSAAKEAAAAGPEVGGTDGCKAKRSREEKRLRKEKKELKEKRREKGEGVSAGEARPEGVKKKKRKKDANKTESV